MVRWRSAINVLLLVSSLWMIAFTVYTPARFGWYARSDGFDFDPDENEADSVDLGRIAPNGSPQQCACPKKPKVAVDLREVPAAMGMSPSDYPDPDTPIRILSWTQLWGASMGPWYPEGSEIFEKCNFKVPLQCEYTHDRKEYDDVDAILFHSFYIKDLPEYRYPDQKWVFWEYECPRIVAINQNLTDYRHMFNVTSTYSMESDVPLPFLRKCIPAIPGERNIHVGPHEKKKKNFAEGKTKGIAWFVSHCQTPGKRELYVKNLQKYIPVDVFGKCGPHTCGERLAVQNHTYCNKEILEKQYRFYLAFENSLCSDYITEKLWNIFTNHLNIIPVVLGAADYTNMLPRGTYIDVRDFKSPAHLAKYLKHIEANDDEYNKYITRRTFHTCRYQTQYRYYYCGLCEHLHRNRGRTEVALDVANDWSPERRCRSARAFYKRIGPDVMAGEEADKEVIFT